MVSIDLAMEVSIPCKAPPLKISVFIRFWS
jgi:hypothetical protein